MGEQELTGYGVLELYTKAAQDMKNTKAKSYSIK